MPKYRKVAHDAMLFLKKIENTEDDKRADNNKGKYCRWPNKTPRGKHGYNDYRTDDKKFSHDERLDRRGNLGKIFVWDY